MKFRINVTVLLWTLFTSLLVGSHERASAQTDDRDAWLRTHAHSLNLESEDFSDLEFLRPLLQGKRVVQLGENTHGVREYSVLKARIVEYLHRELSLLAEHLPNVRMASERFATIWGGASLLSMLLECFKELLSFEDWKWDFVLNLSESDFPVK